METALIVTIAFQIDRRIDFNLTSPEVTSKCCLRFGKYAAAVRLVVRQHSILGLVRGRLARMHGDNAGETPAHRFEPTLILELDAILVHHPA